MKKKANIIILLIIIITLSGCTTIINDDVDIDEPPEQIDNSDLEIHHIDVGQADSTLIITPENETILIDTGHYTDNGEKVLDYLEEQNIEKIDHLVATHAHADHIGGHSEIITHYEENKDGIENIYDNGVPHTTNTYEDYLDTVDEYNKELLIVNETNELPLSNEDEVSINIIHPPEDGMNTDDLNENSVVLQLTYDEFTYLVTGDAGERAEEIMTEKYGSELDSDIYKAGHHGSSTSSNEYFLDEVEPEVAIISSAYDSPHSHPHNEVLDEFIERELITYWTGVHGDIVIETNGVEYAVTVSDNEIRPTAAEIKNEKPGNSLSSSIKSFLDI